MHTLKITNNGAQLISLVLGIPGVFKTPIEVLRVGKLMEKFEVTPPEEDDEQDQQKKKLMSPVMREWMVAEYPEVELSEPQRKLLQTAMEKASDKVTPGKVMTSILEQLGFGEEK